LVNLCRQAAVTHGLQFGSTNMGGKRKDAAKKEEKDEALTNGDAAGDSKADQPTRKETVKKEAAAKTPAEAPNGKGNSTAEQAPAVEAPKEAASKVAETAKAAVTKTAAQVRRFTVSTWLAAGDISCSARCPAVNTTGSSSRSSFVTKSVTTLPGTVLGSDKNRRFS
jgi:hypothetical protein